jgi:hypothetical protein
MTNTNLASTIGAAGTAIAILIASPSSPSVDQFIRGVQAPLIIKREPATSVITLLLLDTGSTSAKTSLATSVGVEGAVFDADRQTTGIEEAVGELRSWKSLTANWDGEGALSPNEQSINAAISFLNALDPRAIGPEPMLLSSGRAGLFWQTDALYADLEFTGEGRITYYIEQKNIGKHKGVVVFDGEKLPALFPTLLLA